MNMKLHVKAVSACAIVAGLLTIGTSKSEALQISGYVVQNVQVKLVATAADGNGNLTKVRITNKDLTGAITADGVTDATGMKIALWDDGYNYYLLNPNTSQLGENLSSDKILTASWNGWWYSSTNHTDGSIKRASEVGTVFIQFASDGNPASTNWGASSLEFIDMSAGSGTAATTWAWKETGSVVNGAGKQTITENETDTFSGYGYEANSSVISNTEGFPINGTITYNGSGTVPWANYAP